MDAMAGPRTRVGGMKPNGLTAIQHFPVSMPSFAHRRFRSRGRCSPRGTFGSFTISATRGGVTGMRCHCRRVARTPASSNRASRRRPPSDIINIEGQVAGSTRSGNARKKSTPAAGPVRSRERAVLRRAGHTSTREPPACQDAGVGRLDNGDDGMSGSFVFETGWDANVNRVDCATAAKSVVAVSRPARSAATSAPSTSGCRRAGAMAAIFRTSRSCRR